MSTSKLEPKKVINHIPIKPYHDIDGRYYLLVAKR